MKDIITKFKKYLTTPYPYYYGNTKRVLFLLLLISVLSFGFSYFFEPFEVNAAEHKISSIVILLVHAFIPFPIAFCYFKLVDRTLKEDTRWTLGKELFQLSIILLLIGIAGFLIRDFIYTNPDNWSLTYFWEEIRNTFLVGFLLIVIVLPLNLERLIHKHTHSVQQLPEKQTKAARNKLISITDAASQEIFELHSSEFLFAKVESNYTEIFTFSATVVHKTLLRITLKELEEQLIPMAPQVFKTHRSYLVHLGAIETIAGNAQGYQLSLKNCHTLIPVSRSTIARFNAVYSKL